MLRQSRINDDGEKDGLESVEYLYIDCRGIARVQDSEVLPSAIVIRGLQRPLTHEDIVSFISSAVLSEVSRLDRHRRQLLNVWSDAWTRSRERSKGPEAREHYVRGESVYIYRKPQHKLDSQWIRGTIMNPIGGQCYEVQLSDGTRQVFHKDHIKPFYISEEEDRVPTPTSRGHKRRDLSSPPTTEGLPPKRRVRIVSSGHPFLAWKDEDGTVRVGSKISWTNDNFFLVHEYKLLEDHRTVAPMYFTPDGILRVGGPPENPATVAVNPKGVSVLKLESPTQLSVESSRKVSAL